jgi:hypothetical protein
MRLYRTALLFCVFALTQGLYTQTSADGQTEEQLAVQQYAKLNFKDAFTHFQKATGDGNSEAYSYLGTLPSL